MIWPFHCLKPLLWILIMKIAFSVHFIYTFGLRILTLRNHNMLLLCLKITYGFGTGNNSQFWSRLATTVGLHTIFFSSSGHISYNRYANAPRGVISYMRTWKVYLSAWVWMDLHQPNWTMVHFQMTFCCRCGSLFDVWHPNLRSLFTQLFFLSYSFKFFSLHAGTIVPGFHKRYFLFHFTTTFQNSIYDRTCVIRAVNGRSFTNRIVRTANMVRDVRKIKILPCASDW